MEALEPVKAVQRRLNLQSERVLDHNNRTFPMLAMETLQLSL
jgi:hypothetical protein